MASNRDIKQMDRGRLLQKLFIQQQSRVRQVDKEQIYEQPK
jgi:hypothetical protein